MLEEIRALVRSGLISKTSYYKVLNFLPMQGKDRFCVDIDTNSGDCVARDGDLYLLSGDPERLDDSGVIAIAKDTGHYQHYVRGFQVRILEDISSSKLTFAILLCNIQGNILLWQSIHKVPSDKPLISKIPAPSLIVRSQISYYIY